MQNFSDTDAIAFISYQFSDESEITDFIQSSELNTLKTFQAAKLPVSIALFYSEKVQSDWSLDENKVLGYLCYYMEDQKLKTKLVKRESGNESTIDFLSTDTRFISSNDKFTIAQKVLPGTQSIISLSHRDRIPPINSSSVAEFQDRVKYYAILTTGYPDLEDGKVCPKPCQQIKGLYYCVEQERQNGPNKYGCIITPQSCSKTKVDAFASGHAISNEDADHNNTQLRQFRDNYLSTRIKGIRYISTYNFLSDQFNYEQLDVSYAIKAIAIIKNDIIPLIDKLTTDPNAETVLIDNEQAGRILSFLDESAYYFPDAYSKDLIEGLKADLNTCKGQSTQYVHEFLNN